jgi:hypothetical protein
MADKQFKIVLGYNWQDPQENSVRRICKIIKERRGDTGRQNPFASIREKRSLLFYSGKKLE